MTDWMDEVLQQVPALAVLAWVVFHFLRSSDRARKEFVDCLRETSQHTDLVAKQCHEHQAIQSEAVKEMAGEIKEVAVALAQVVEALRRINGTA